MNHSDNKAKMISVSFILALASIATFQIFFISLPCASVSIILALISRGNGPLLPRAKAALICAVAAAALTTSITVTTLYVYTHNPQVRAEIEQIYNYYTDPEAEDSDGSVSSQDLLRDILSGKYREDKQKNDSSDTAPGLSGGSVDGTQSPDDFSSQNGGSVI